MPEPSQEPRVIDLTFQGETGIIASFLLESEGELALLETGPESCLETLLDSLARLNVDPAGIAKLIVTHIHLDHSGAAGAFMQRFPRARVYVHERGAPHLIDPSRLVASATRIYGDRMHSLWGQIEPVPADRVVVVGDGDTIRIGARTLEVLYTPGHAVHHVAYYDGNAGNLFAGDVAACRLQGIAHVRPPTPPPEVDLEAWDRSLDRIAQRAPATLFLTHFGPFRDPDRHIQEARENLARWADMVQGGMERGQSREEIVEQVDRYGERIILDEMNDPALLPRYELAAPSGMSVDGLMRYFRKKA